MTIPRTDIVFALVVVVVSLGILTSVLKSNSLYTNFNNSYHWIFDSISVSSGKLKQASYCLDIYCTISSLSQAYISLFHFQNGSTQQRTLLENPFPLRFPNAPSFKLKLDPHYNIHNNNENKLQYAAMLNSNNITFTSRNNCPYTFKIFVYPIPSHLSSIRLSEEARHNHTYHVCHKCILEQFSLEYIIYDFFTQFCGRTLNPEEADYFYLPIIRDTEYRVNLHNGGKLSRDPSATEVALLDILEHSKYEKWKELFQYTDKYWKAKNGYDHILVMPAPVTNLRHESNQRGYFHYMYHLFNPIFFSIEYSLSFVLEYPICSRYKNILLPYPNLDPNLFNSQPQPHRSAITTSSSSNSNKNNNINSSSISSNNNNSSSSSSSRSGSGSSRNSGSINYSSSSNDHATMSEWKRTSLFVYLGGLHGSCVEIRKAIKNVMMNCSHILINQSSSSSSVFTTEGKTGRFSDLTKNKKNDDIQQFHPVHNKYHRHHHDMPIKVIGDIIETLIPPPRFINHQTREKIFQTSVFCPIPVGDSPSSKRMYDVMHFGCIPVVLSDDLVWSFTDINTATAATTTTGAAITITGAAAATTGAAAATTAATITGAVATTNTIATTNSIPSFKFFNQSLFALHLPQCIVQYPVDFLLHRYASTPLLLGTLPATGTTIYSILQCITAENNSSSSSSSVTASSSSSVASSSSSSSVTASPSSSSSLSATIIRNNTNTSANTYNHIHHSTIRTTPPPPPSLIPMIPLVQLLLRIPVQDVLLLQQGVRDTAPSFRYYANNKSMSEIPIAYHQYPNGKAIDILAALLEERKVKKLIEQTGKDCQDERLKRGHKYRSAFPCESNNVNNNNNKKKKKID